MLRDFIFEYAKKKLFGPKDYFERQKKRLVNKMILPLIIIMGGPPIIAGILSNLASLELNYSGLIIKLVGIASSDLLALAITIGVSFLFALGCNLYYASHVKETDRQITELDNNIKKEESFRRLFIEYINLMNEGDSDSVASVRQFLLSNFSNELKLNPDILIAISNKEGLRAYLLSHGVDKNLPPLLQKAGANGQILIR